MNIAEVTAEVSPMTIAEIGNVWEGHIIEARLPLRQWLGSSDHSCVYLTEIAGPHSPKAVVKMFPADFFDFDHQVARWRSLAQLDCPFLLRLLDGGRSEIEGTPFFFVVTDFAEENLAQVLPQRALAPNEVEDLLPSLLEGLAYLHQSGLVHGHLQPANIMAAEDQLKLPVERVYAAGELRDCAGPLTPYDAPEIAWGELTPAADVWSLGMFLVAALRQHPLSLRGQHAPEIPAGIPEPLHSIISNCLTVDPQDRCTLAEIAAWLQPAPVAQAAPAPIPARLRIVDVPDQPIDQTNDQLIDQTSHQPSAKLALELIAKPTVEPVRTGTSGWRMGAPIAAIVLIAALMLGQKLLGHRPGLAAASSATPAVASTAPAARAVLHRVIPEVPWRQRKTIPGQIQVGVQVEVDASGRVIAAKAVSPGPSRYLANLALQTAQQWQFTPAQDNGTPVPSAWLLRFQFGRRSAQVVPSPVK